MREIKSKEESVRERLSYLIGQEDLGKTEIREKEDGIHITLDVHGWSRAKVAKVIHNINLLQKEAFRLTVIHGYVHSTAIKQMLASGFKEERLIEEWRPQYNPGLTCLRFKAAA